MRYSRLNYQIGESPEIGELLDSNPLAVALFTLAIARADVYGILPREPRRFRTRVCPAASLSLKDVEKALADMEGLGLIRSYDAEGDRKFLFITNYHKHQVVKWERVGPPEDPLPLWWNAPKELVAAAYRTPGPGSRPTTPALVKWFMASPYNQGPLKGEPEQNGVPEDGPESDEPQEDTDNGPGQVRDQSGTSPGPGEDQSGPRQHTDTDTNTDTHNDTTTSGDSSRRGSNPPLPPEGHGDDNHSALDIGLLLSSVNDRCRPGAGANGLRLCAKRTKPEDVQIERDLWAGLVAHFGFDRVIELVEEADRAMMIDEHGRRTAGPRTLMGHRKRLEDRMEQEKQAGGYGTPRKRQDLRDHPEYQLPGWPQSLTEESVNWHPTEEEVAALAQLSYQQKERVMTFVGRYVTDGTVSKMRKAVGLPA